MLKQQVSILEAKIVQLKQMLDKNETTEKQSHRSYNNFKFRILDMPWTQTMQPVLDRIPELESIISSKVLTEFPTVLCNLQRKIIDILFNEEKYTGVTVVQTLSQNGDHTNTLRLQINLKQTKMTDDEILNFYHNGMIDYLEFSFNPRTENLLNKLGEKFILTAGNIATYTDSPSVGCKIFSSFPEATGLTYRPARKRVYISHRLQEQNYFKTMACTSQINMDSLMFKEATADRFKTWVEQGQKTPELPYSFRWRDYKLLAEGHYVQIWSHYNWAMLLPFVGESSCISITDIYNGEDDPDTQSDPGSPFTLPDTHRDF